MKILIAYASAGIGHRRAAEAVYEYFKNNFKDKDIDLKIIDVLEKSNFIFKNFYRSGYLFLVHNALWLWGFFFWMTSAKSLRPISNFFGFFAHRINTERFCRYLIQENPDFIISTHFLPSGISAYLKVSKSITGKIITVITDFGVHPFWISKGIDIFFVASERTKEILIREGVKNSHISVSGIPVNSKFIIEYEKNALREKFNLDKDKFTVLVITGSFGIGPMEEIINLLYKDAQILVVCGDNKGLYKRLTDKNYPDVKVFGFVSNVQELMAVSDIIITKPGGLTISEALIKELVPLFISPIPGQETENIKILKSYGIGFYIKKTEDLRRIVLDFKNNPGKLKEIKGNIKKIRLPLSAKDICDALCKDSFGPAH